MVLSASGQEDKLAESLDSGADDFLVKPIDKNELKARMRAASRIVRLTQRMRAEAETDALTGAYNRRVFMRTLEREHFSPISGRQGGQVERFDFERDRTGQGFDNTGSLAFERRRIGAAEHQRPGIGQPPRHAVIAFRQFDARRGRIAQIPSHAMHPLLARVRAPRIPRGCEPRRWGTGWRPRMRWSQARRPLSWCWLPSASSMVA